MAAKLSNVRRLPGGGARFRVHGGDRGATVSGIALLVGLALVGFTLAVSSGDEGAVVGWLLGTVVALLLAYFAILWGLFAPYAVDVDPRAAQVTARRVRRGVLWTAPLSADRLHLVPTVRTFGRQRIPVTALVFGERPAGELGDPPPHPALTVLSTGPVGAMAAIRDELIAGLPPEARSVGLAGAAVPASGAGAGSRRQRAWFVAPPEGGLHVALWAPNPPHERAGGLVTVLRPTHALFPRRAAGFGIACQARDVPAADAEGWLAGRGYRLLAAMSADAADAHDAPWPEAS